MSNHNNKYHVCRRTEYVEDDAYADEYESRSTNISRNPIQHIILLMVEHYKRPHTWNNHNRTQDISITNHTYTQ